MKERIITDGRIKQFCDYLMREEKSCATREKYMRDVFAFYEYVKDRPLTKELVIAYKKECIGRGYAARSVNSMLSSINSFLRFAGWEELRVKNIRIQHQTYCAEEKELTKSEYMLLLNASKPNEQLHLLLQTICGTGIRVSELKYFTVESVRKGIITVSCKNKTRTILIPHKLANMLIKYAKKRKITSGAIFVGKNGKPLDRSCIWRSMKKLCEIAGVCATKVFPHNLRKLFARTFYNVERDIAKLADILGHSSINTTRIYIMTTGKEYYQKIERLGLVLYN